MTRTATMGRIIPSLVVLACSSPPPGVEGKNTGAEAGSRELKDAETLDTSTGHRDARPDAAPYDSSSEHAHKAAIKWNPGHYMLTYTQLYNSRTITVVQDEITALSKSAGVVGYKSFVTWAYLEPNENDYNFADIDAMIGSGGQFTLMSPPRHLILQLNPNVFNSGSPEVPGTGDDRFLPSYIVNDPATYGEAVLGNSGLSNPNGYGGFWVQATGGYCANLVNANVQARLVALLQAIGKRYDDNPLFEGVVLCATDDMYPVAGSGISTTEYISALESILNGATAAMPQSNIAIQNAWAGEVTASQEFEEWMLEHRVLPGSSDTAGAPAWTSADHSYAPSNLSWGIQAWLGIQASGSTWTPPSPSLKTLGHAMMDIQGGDITTPSQVYPQYGPYTPLQITQACNTQYGCSHAFWTYLTASDDYSGFTVPTEAQWPNLLATIQANPLTNVSYPSVYP
jgi:hypothetical protein